MDYLKLFIIVNLVIIWRMFEINNRDFGEKYINYLINGNCNIINKKYKVLNNI